MKFFFKFVLIFFLSTNILKANDEASSWLKEEIDTILNAYQNDLISNIERFTLIEQTIDKNFAGAGIANFVIVVISWAPNPVRQIPRWLPLRRAFLVAGWGSHGRNQRYEVRRGPVNTQIPEWRSVHRFWLGQILSPRKLRCHQGWWNPHWGKLERLSQSACLEKPCLVLPFHRCQLVAG